MNHRAWLAILAAAFLSTAALAQSASHFDVSGSVSYSGSQVPGASSGASTTQIDGYGWQASGISHFNRWLSLTSEFSNSSASANSISLIGYTGPGTVKHYSVLAGPRIYLPFAFGSRFSPFVEGLAGYDRAETSLTSNGAAVTGNETQIAYAFGGGAQVGLSRRFGLNFEAAYFGSQHTLAFTGWEPSHFQLSAGIVIRLFGARGQPQIAKERPLPPPSAPANTESARVMTAPTPSQPAPEQLAVVQPVPIVRTAVVAQPIAEAPKPIQRQQPIVATTAPAPTPAPSPKPAPVVAAAIVTPSIASKPLPTPTPASQPKPQPVAPAQRVAVSTPPVPPVNQVAQSDVQPSQPISLGEYARRLREKKQKQQSSIHFEN